MSDYQINIRPSGKSFEWVVTDPNGEKTYSDKRHNSEISADLDAIRYVKTRRATTTAPAPQATPAPEGWSKYGRLAGQASVHQMMESTFGVSSPSYARGDCHYCGQKLNRRGFCEECD